MEKTEEILSPADMQEAARSMGMSMSKVCQQAGIAHTTYHRWRRGKHQLRLDIYKRLRDALRAGAAD